jgi:hypothetical protein
MNQVVMEVQVENMGIKKGIAYRLSLFGVMINLTV